MIKSIMVVKRKPGMSREEFYKYWEEVHAPMAAKHMPGVIRYVQNHLAPVPGNDSDEDGIVEMWWEDYDSYKKCMDYMNTDEGKFLKEDGKNFVDGLSQAKVWLVEEHVIK